MALERNEVSVQTYLNILQGIKNRLAGNSLSCKTWCVTIVAAVLVLALDKSKPETMLVALVPIGFLLLLDAYYLSLERDFRDIYNNFVADLSTGAAKESSVFVIAPDSGLWHRTKAVLGSCFSLSAAPFYGMLGVAVVVAMKLVTQTS